MPSDVNKDCAGYRVEVKESSKYWKCDEKSELQDWQVCHSHEDKHKTIRDYRRNIAG